ncbi:MAG: PPC domain-containing DNA-binding protein [Desulfobaccales bacterium]
MNITVTPGRKIIGRLAKGEDLLAALEKVAREHGITLGEVQAIGAVSQARVGYYKQAERKYYFLDLTRPLEILCLTGNISLKDGNPMVHAHVTLSDGDGRAFGGHLAEGTLVFACEFAIQEYQSATALVRQMDDPTGLFLWPYR